VQLVSAKATTRNEMVVPRRHHGGRRVLRRPQQKMKRAVLLKGRAVKLQLESFGGAD
jgi:hypothetical protein